MGRARAVLFASGVASLVACTSLSGIDDLRVGTDDDLLPAAEGGAPEPGGGPVERDAQSTRDANEPAPPPDLPPGPTGWTYRRPITLSSGLAESPASYPVLVLLPASFEYAKAKSDGADLRFSRTDKHGDDLPYWVERWEPKAESAIWVLVPKLPRGVSTLQLFYGNANANAAAASFEALFPRAQKTAGNGNGNLTATDDIDVDWFELRSGDTLTLPQGKPFKISARRIILAGKIDGDAKGYAPGHAIGALDGKGPGGGKTKAGSGGGGGGYGGAGGAGGADSGTGGAAGAAIGSDTTIDMGSGGGAGLSAILGGLKEGGHGGGAVSLLGWSTSVSGKISVNGQGGKGGQGQCAGGGSGGGILVAGSFLDLAGAELTAKGGGGGATANEGSDGGGGGGGGRINLHSRKTGLYAAPASMSVGQGSGGTGGGTSAPGKSGSVGVTAANDDSNLLPGVEAVLGTETAGY